MASDRAGRLQGDRELRQARVFQAEAEDEVQQRELHRRYMGQTLDVEREVGRALPTLWTRLLGQSEVGSGPTLIDGSKSIAANDGINQSV